MFHLEDSIANWRRQMLAAGIRTPVPLEELEGHLRDDVEQQAGSGLGTQQAFEAAVQRIGPAIELKSEFEIVRSNHNNPGESMKQKLIRVLSSVVVMFIAIGLILPALAKLRELGEAVRFDIAMLLIGTAILTSSAMFGAYSIFKTSKA